MVQVHVPVEGVEVRILSGAPRFVPVRRVVDVPEVLEGRGTVTFDERIPNARGLRQCRRLQPRPGE